MTKSCLKLRCPACKGRTRLTTEAFESLRRRPTTVIEHTCEHCGHRFPATLLSGLAPAVEKTPVAHRIREPQPAPEPMPAFAPKAAEVPQAPAPVPFTPRSAPAAAEAPPFGPLGERAHEAPARARADAPLASPPPFAAGAAADAPKFGKQSLNDWWKSQSPKRQWTFLACVAVMIGAVVVMLPIGESASASETPAAIKRTAESKKETTKAARDAAKVEEEAWVETKTSGPTNEAFGLLCQETAGLGGKIETPLAAAVAVDGKGFVVRAAKVFADLHNAGGSTAKWFVATPTKRHKVTGVRFHPEFPAEKLKALAAKGAQAEMLELIKAAEHSDVALLETAEAPAASLTLARDPAAISGKPLEIAAPADVKATKGGQPLVVKFARQALTPAMLKDDGAGLAVPLGVGCDAAVTTKEGLLAAFVPRKNVLGPAVHAIVPAETLAELLGAK